MGSAPPDTRPPTLLASCPQPQLSPAFCLHLPVSHSLLVGQVLELGVGSGRGLRWSCRTFKLAFGGSVTGAGAGA